MTDSLNNKRKNNDFNTHLQGLVNELRRDAKPLAGLCYKLGASSHDLAKVTKKAPSTIRRTYPKDKLLKEVFS